ncbi:MAG TPA: metallophosphoesterase [Gaiellaceae bacterium]|jgi:3',5'-cyclic AMP phosphodiesterase CpdA
MITRLLQVSDLHFGGRDELAGALDEVIARLTPDLVVATGDLTHRGRREQHQLAGTFLHDLGVPVIAVPGNHDIPYRLPARFTSPWAEFERVWMTTEPVHASEALHVVGLNSVRPWRHQSGGVSRAALARAANRLAGAAPGALRVVALHHQFVNAPWRMRKRPLARRAHVLATLADAGAELFISGHVHQATVSDRREFAVGVGGAVLSNAPGLARPRPDRLGEASGCVLYTATENELTVDNWIRSDGWTLVGSRRYARAST